MMISTREEALKLIPQFIWLPAGAMKIEDFKDDDEFMVLTDSDPRWKKISSLSSKNLLLGYRVTCRRPIPEETRNDMSAELLMWIHNAAIHPGAFMDWLFTQWVEKQ